MTKARDLADLLDSNGNLIAKGVVDGRDLATDGSKLDGVEAAATADQTHSEIRALITIGVDTNVFTDADHTKLDGIEASATADQTDAEIRTAVEAATDSNVFTDADHTKLDAIEASATADQTGAQIKASYEAETNAFTDAQFTKLAGIETAATADQTKADIDALNINADLLDGQHGAYYTGYTDTAVAGIVDSSPAALNTLNELAAALGDDANYATTTATSIGTKLPKSGGAMTGAITTSSTFDGRNVSVDGAKLDGIEASADVTDTANVVAALTAGSNITIAANGTIAGAAQYTHPTHDGDDAAIDTGALSGATVISDLDFNITTDTLGHVTDANATVATRNLTLANLGYTGETDATADQTAAQLLTAIKTVDGAGNGLDADLLDGVEGANYLRTDINDTVSGSPYFNSGANIRRNSHSSGYLVGGYNNIAPNDSMTNPIYTIGSAYQPSDTDLSNMYGIGYTDANAAYDGINTVLDGWGMYVAAGGVARIGLTGQSGRIYGVSVVASGTITANSFSGDGSGLTGLGGGTPAGAVIYHAASTAPTGFIKANGASISTSTYSDLFAVIGYSYGGSGGSFNVPDLRGEFLRGWDNSRGVDSGRNFGSSQTDELKSHNHTAGLYFYDAATPRGQFRASYGAGYQGAAATSSTGGSETRPRNVALLACIKY